MSDLVPGDAFSPVPPPLYGDVTGAPVLAIPSGAGFGIRFLARLIDLIYGVFIGLIVGVCAGILFAILTHLGRLTPEWPRLIKVNSVASYALGFLGGFLYQAVCEGVGTVSIGKLFCGLRVVQVDGGPATMKGAALRDLAYFIDALFFGLVGYVSMSKGPLKQRYGDLWGGTVVVKADVFEPRPVRSPLRMAMGIVAGSVLWAGVGFLQMVLKVM
jgi:uncharacterized RDD family membrane protein YckC